MKIITSRNKEYQGSYIEGPTRIGGSLMMRIEDSRNIPEIAEEFCNLEWIQRKSDEQGSKEWTGYNKLVGIREVRKGIVMIELSQS